MAVKLDTDAHYYLIPRHSEKVLEVKDAATGRDSPIQQNAPLKDKSHQRFKFNPTRDGMYAIRCEQSQYVFDVAGISKDDGAKVIQVPWHSGLNQQFRLLDAGEGHVFIEAVHSGKLVAVRDGATGDGVELVQRQNPGTADAHKYQFRLVLASSTMTPAALPTFKKPLDIVRDIGLGAAGLIPEIGGAAKFVLGAFWPDQSDQLFWDQMTQYVDRYVDAQMTAKRLEDLSVTLEGARKNLSDMADMNPGVDKMSFFNATYAAINQVDRAFFIAGKADKTLAYLMAMGTLKIRLLHQLTADYGKISDTADTNVTAHRRWLTEAVAEYAAAVQKFRKEIYDKRMAKVERSAGIDYPPYAPWCWLRAFDWHTNYAHMRRIDSKTNYPVAARLANELVATANRNAKALYDAELDALLASTLLWNSYGPDRPAPPRETVYVEAGPFGSDYGSDVETTQTLADNAAIQGVRVYGGTALAGIAVKVDGTWHSVGKTEGTPSEIELRKDERIVSVYGTADYRLMSIRFETNFGRRAGAGDDISAQRWSADIPADLEPVLVGVKSSALKPPQGMAGITLTWRYERLGGYPALPARRKAKKRVAKKPAAKRVAPKKAVAKKVVAKKAPAGKAPAKRAVPKKAAVKKVAAKKTVAKKAVAKKAVVKKAPARRAAPKKAAVKRGRGRRV